MADKPVNQAPEQSDALYAVYARKNNTGNTFSQIPENQFANAVGKTASNKGEIFYIDANGDVAELTAGSSTAIAYINASGLPAWTASGSDTNVLALSGTTPTWTANPSAVRFIQAQTGSAASSIDFTTGFDSTYDEYVFDLIGVYPSTAGSPILMRVSEDGGLSFHSTNYYAAAHGWANAVTYGVGNGSTAETSHNFHGAGASVGPNNAAADALVGQARLFLTTTRASILSVAGWKNNSGTVANQLGILNAWSQRATTSRANAVRFLASSGNINGKILMYGVKNT